MPTAGDRPAVSAIALKYRRGDVGSPIRQHPHSAQPAHPDVRPFRSAHSGLVTYEGCDHPAHIASMSTPPTAPIATEPKSCVDSRARWYISATAGP